MTLQSILQKVSTAVPAFTGVKTSTTIRNILVLAFLGLLQAREVGDFDTKELQRLEKVGETPAARHEVKITMEHQRYDKNQGQISPYQQVSKAGLKQEADDVILLLTLIAIFGVIFLAMVIGICVYVYNENKKEKEAPASEIQLKNIQTASKDIIVNKLNRIKKGTSEEGLKLIAEPDSGAPSDITAATKEDYMSNYDNSSSILRNMDDPFQVKNFKNSCDDDEEKKKVTTPSKLVNPTKQLSAPSRVSSIPSATPGSKSLKVNTARGPAQISQQKTSVRNEPNTPPLRTAIKTESSIPQSRLKYDRKDPKQVGAAAPRTQRQPMTTQRAVGRK